MRLYLTILLLILATSYRFTRKRHIDLPQVPTQIYYLQDDLLVTQTGRSITVYNTTNDLPIQTFTADSDNPKVEISQ